MLTATCPPGFAERLDRALAGLIPGMSRGQARRLIAAGSVFVDDRRCRVASRVVRAGCHLRVEDGETPPPATKWLSILYEDAECLAVDKPAGMPSAPTRQAAAGSMLEELRRERGGDFWLLHRLDHGTSGVLLFARTRAAARRLSDSFRRREVDKTYVAWIDGRLETDSGRVDARIRTVGSRAAIDDRGQEAETRWSVVAREPERTLVRLEPTTGRMHQLRIHMASLGHPVVGDRLYGGPLAPRLMLHAERLRFPHPADGHAVELHAPAGDEFDHGQ